MNARVCFLLLLPIFGCATTAPAPPSAPVIVLEEEPDGEHWRATWRLAEPTRELLFERRAAGFRSRVFEVLTPGFAFSKRGEQEVLRTAGEPVREITVRFPEYSDWLQKEYEFFQTFSDGSVAVYTGHLVARPMGGGEPEECDECFLRSFRFVAQPESSIIVDGRVERSPVDWVDEEEQGSYVYFGSIEPVETREMISIVDPALPDWLENETKTALPWLFELYTERLGVQLPERPTVLFSWDETEQSGTSSGGGTLPGQIQLTVQGTGWHERSEGAMVQLFQFLAHEAVHLWNGQIVNYPDSEDSWMHEGSADGLAQRTLLELGLIDDAQFLEVQSAALNECLRGLDGSPLRDAGERRTFHLYYQCGNAIGLLTESTIGESDLFDFWRVLVAESLESRQYEANDYYDFWRKLGGSADIIDGARHFVEAGASAEALLGLLRDAGIHVAETEPSQPYGQSVARDALLHLMSQACRGSYGFNASPEGLKLSSGLDCGAIPGGGVVKKIGGHDVLREGHASWDHLHERCGGDGSVDLQIELEEGSVTEVSVLCAKPVSVRPTYVEIRGRNDG